MLTKNTAGAKFAKIPKNPPSLTRITGVRINRTSRPEVSLHMLVVIVESAVINKDGRINMLFRHVFIWIEKTKSNFQGA